MGKKIWKHKDATMKSGDTIVVDGKPTDVVIAIMGPPGVGKSTFIDALFGEGTASPGHRLRSITSHVQHFIRLLPSDPARRLVVVEMPGFDDTYVDVDEAEILRRISVWLATSYASDMKLAGIIYLHDITRRRMGGQPRLNLEMFRKLCGDQAFSSVVLGTTQWSEVERGVGEDRLQALKTNFWSDMIERGSYVFKFENTNASAWSMVNYLLEKRNYDALQIQRELVDLQKIIPDTSAGKELRSMLEQRLEIQRDNATYEQKELRSMLEQRLEIQRIKAMEEQIQKTLTTIQALKAPSRLAFMSPARWGLAEVVEEQFVAIRSSYRSSAQHGSTTKMQKSSGHNSSESEDVAGTVPGVVVEETQESYQVSKKTGNFLNIFEKARNFSIGAAVMHEGANSTINYTHTSTVNNNRTYHFQQSLDHETLKLIIQDPAHKSVDVVSDSDGVHIHCQQPTVTTSSKQQLKPS